MGGRSGRTRGEDGARADLRLHALGFPGAWEDFPWGESVIKVGKKVFVFLGRSGGALSVSGKIGSAAWRERV